MSRGTKEPRRSRRKQSQQPPNDGSSGHGGSLVSPDLGPAEAMDGLVAEVLQASGEADPVGICSPLLARLASLTDAERAPWQLELERVRGEVSAMSAQDGAEMVRERLEACLQVLAGALGGGRAGALVGTAPVQAAAVASTVVERPAWVDDAMIGDFLKVLPDTLDELEGSAVALENGDDVDLNALKRTLHTLKGEAGLLGLDALAQVAHASEDVLVAAVAREQQGTALLDALEWMRNARLAYREGRLPAEAPRRLLPAEATSQQASPSAPAGAGSGDASHEAGSTLSEAHGARTEISRSPSELTGGGADDSGAGPCGAVVSPGSLPRDEETLAVVAEFLDETEEGLIRADQILMNVERDGLNEEATHGLFRTFHSIKGVSASLGLDAIAALAHSTENVLNLVRKGSLTLAGPPLDVVFDATECMRGMLSDLRAAAQSNAELACPDNLAGILARLEAVESGVNAAAPERAVAHVAPAPPAPVAPVPAAPEPSTSAGEARSRDTREASGATSVAQQTAVEQAATTSRGEATRAAAPNKADFSLKEVIKVDVERIDSLVEMIGELVIAESMVVNLPEVAGISSHVAQKYLSQLTKITRDLQRVGMSMRMVQVKTVFQKMARVVRDIAKKSNKNVTLQITGDSAEMDRGMVDAIAEPIVHMVRNSVDHGLEPAEERLARGKPEHGTIRLSATHEGGSIVIEISDDGRGLDTERILEKARSLGIVGAHQVLSDTEVHELIFHPGFSTAREVTEISGRGVGMDVVKRAIEALHGRIHIETSRGVGTTFRFVLPITLAIIDGMLIAVGDESYIIPTRTVVESVQPEADDIKTFANSSEMLLLRGELIPLLRLERIFGVQEAKQDVTDCLIVVVESVGRKIGILVDGVITQQQVVIKNLGRGINSSQYISGAAILSNGRVGLILNVEAFGHLFGETRGFGVARSALSGAA